MKKILVYLERPAHFPVYKNAVANWQTNGNKVIIVIGKNDVSKKLLQDSGFEYFDITEEGRKGSKPGMFIGMIKRTIRLMKYCRKNKPEILTGTGVEISFAGKILHIPVVIVSEDDIAAAPFYVKLSYSFAGAILTPSVCNSGKWNNKAIKYESYHELAYLHPDHFTPEKRTVEKYFSAEKPYFIISFAKFDDGIQGINTETIQKLIDILQPYGDIHITSESELEPQFKQYRIRINSADIHHVTAFAQLYIGDSQTTAAEAGVLGVPFVLFSDFVGRIGYLHELEDCYHLGYGIGTGEPEKLFSTVSKLVAMPNRRENFQQRRRKMLSEKIDYAKFLTWFIENYPDSAKMMKENSEYQYEL